MNTPNKRNNKNIFDDLSFWLCTIPAIIAFAIITVSGGGL